jgi:hypothetical protein
MLAMHLLNEVVIIFLNAKVSHAFNKNITMKNRLLKSIPSIVVDWGTTNLRIWLISCDGEVIDKRQSTKGMGSFPC